MKKLFFYAAAAVAMLAGCQKAEVSGTQAIDDSTPAAIKFGVDAPALTVTKAATKAAVDAWANTEVFVYGIKQEREANALKALGEGLYNFDNILISDYKTYANPANDPAMGSLSALAVYADAEKQMPYYYAEGETYDFYGYHLGGAVAETAVKGVDVISYPVTIAGNNDVMYAYTDRAADLTKAVAGSDVLEADLYSAWAARRGVQPTLKFEHALTRFNFIVVGEGANAADYEQVTIKSIELADMATTGTLTVVGAVEALGFVAKDDAVKTLPLMSIVDGQDVAYVPEKVTANTEKVAAGNGSCLMVAPGLESVKVVVNMVNNKYADSELPSYEFTVEAAKIKANGAELGEGAKFEKGKSYNIIIKVKGPKEITIEAALTDWVEGGDYEYDSDVRPGTGAQTPSTPVEPSEPEYVYTELTNTTPATVTATATKEEYEAALPASYVANNPYEVAKASFPWIGTSFAALPAGTVLKVQVLNEGTPVSLEKIASWPQTVVAADNLSALLTAANEVSYLGFEVVNELGLPADTDLSKLSISIAVQGTK